LLADLEEADLSDLVALRKVPSEDDFEVVHESWDVDVVETVRIKFFDFVTALAYLSERIKPDKRRLRNTFVSGYELPNGTFLVPQGCCIGKGAFYYGYESQEQQLALLNRARQEFDQYKSKVMENKGS
jgi:hypothetical protein